MKFWDRLKSALATVIDAVHPGDPAIRRIFGIGRRSASGARVDEESVLSLSGIFAAIQVYAGTIGSLPLHVYRREGRMKELALAHPAYNALHTTPNIEMTSCVARGAMITNAILYGKACAEIVWLGNGAARGYWPIEPWRVKEKRDENDALYYEVHGRRGTRNVAAADMLYVPHVTTDGVVGKGFVDYATESLGLAISAQQFSAAVLGNGGFPGGILYPKRRLSAKARKNLRGSFKRDVGGASRAGDVYVLEEEVDYKQMGASPEDLQLLGTMQWSLPEVSRWTNLPPHMLRDLSRSTNNNIEQQSIELIMYSFNPWLVRFEQEYDRKMLDPPNLYCKHNVDGLLRGDTETQSAFFKSLFDMGVYSPNDIREILDRNPVPGGDKRFVPLNVVSLEKAGEPPDKKPQNLLTPDEEPATNDRLRDTHRAIVAEVLGRMLRKETLAAQRAAEKPREFLTWLDSFYAKHALTFAEAIEPAMAAALAIDGRDEELATAIQTATAAHVARSREELLAAADGDPAQFAARVEACTERWQQQRTTFERSVCV